MLTYPLYVTIDTNVFHAAKYDLSDNSTLSLLKKYVQDGKIKVVLSEIVIRESKKHISEQINLIIGKARTLRQEILDISSEHLINSIELNSLTVLHKDKESYRKKGLELFDNFIKDIDAEILNLDLINLQDILDDYFDVKPPFAQGEKRKEFPDAFIAYQINKRFGQSRVAIISNDKGFKAACDITHNRLFFDRLGELYDKITREEKEYNETLEIVLKRDKQIISSVLDYIKENENFTVNGLNYDADDVQSGFDYSSIELIKLSNPSFHVHWVDALSDETSLLTLAFKVDIEVACYYEDYDNAPWDSEEKRYLFVDTIEIIEKHSTSFPCRIELNRKTNVFNILPFNLVLGGDSIKMRYSVPNESDYQDYIDMERENTGFRSLSSYEFWLEEDFADSETSKKLIEQFYRINALHCTYDTFYDVFESLTNELENVNKAQKIVSNLAQELKDISNFPSIVEICNITQLERESVKRWVDNKAEYASMINEVESLPDTLNFGDEIIINGVDNTSLVLSIDALSITPVPGDEELVKIHVLSDTEIVARGYIKLTIGYLEKDDDGNLADGVVDDIEYNCDEVIEKIDEYIQAQQNIVEMDSRIVQIIEKTLTM